jgi:hypothetical protein
VANDPTLNDEGFSVLPASTEPPSSDEALTLEDTLANPDALPTVADPPTPLGRAPKLDFVARTFVPNTAGGPLMVYGTDTLSQWVEKCLRTRRGENPAVDPDYGLDRLFLDMIDGSPYDESTAAEFEGIVERAVSVHPAIDSIEEWSIDYLDGDDAATIRFTVIPVAQGQDSLDIDVQLPATGANSA